MSVVQLITRDYVSPVGDTEVADVSHI